MSRSSAALVAFCLFVSACDQAPPGIPGLPGGTSPTPVPQPQPSPPVEFTEISVGQTVRGIVPALPTACVGGHWPCVHFQVTAPIDGTLIVELSYKPETQPPGKFGGHQAVDVSIVDEFGRETWADSSTPTATRASVAVTAGRVYRLVLWYTYADLEYELHTRLQ